MKVNKQKQIN